MYHFTIIGFGATGVSFLRQLHSQIHEQEIKPIKIAIISPVENLSTGVAFGQAERFHQVNTPPKLMGIDPEDPQGFISWIWKNKEQAGYYPTRLIYSDYLKYIYQSLNNDSKLKITEYHATAIDIDITRDRQTIYLDDGRNLDTQRTILTLGKISAPVFNTVLEPGPIAPHAIPQLKPSTPSRVLVAGTGLTAVDCVRSLARQGCPSIHMFSRNGFAPTVLSNSAVYTPQCFTWHNLKHELIRHKRGRRLPVIIRLLRRELECMPDPEVFHANQMLAGGDIGEYWNYLLDRSARSTLPFQDTLVSTRYFAHKLWRKLSERERITFQHNFGSFWACWRHPIPAEVVQELNQYVQSGQLHIHQSMTPPKYEDGKYILKTSHKAIYADGFVDGTGGSDNMKNVSSSLVRNLLNKGLAKAHPCGGLCVDNLTYAVLNDAQMSGLYCLGPLAKGVLFSTNAFWFNAHCASNLAYYFAIEMRLKSRAETFT